MLPTLCVLHVAKTMPLHWMEPKAQGWTPMFSLPLKQLSPHPLTGCLDS